MVDDNVDAAESFADLLKEMGHEVRIANDGKAALELNKEWQAQVIFLDIGLPGIDGYEVARRLRASHFHRPMKIIAVTGWGTNADKERSRQAGIDIHLVKPIDSNDLRMALENGATLH